MGHYGATFSVSLPSIVLYKKRFKDVCRQTIIIVMEQLRLCALRSQNFEVTTMPKKRQRLSVQVFAVRRREANEL